ncbi:MAG: helix-turn-helix domain-containing protein [Halopseudomonas yangmingensis]
MSNSTEQITAWCQANGHWISADGRVTAEVAALILDRSPATLRNWRTAGEGPPYFQGARIKYRISDLAEYLEQFRITPTA